MLKNRGQNSTMLEKRGVNILHPTPKVDVKILHRLNKANLRDLIAATGLVILLKFDPNHRFFVPCDLEI